MNPRFASLVCGAVLLVAPVVSAQSLVSWGPSTEFVTATTAGQRTAAGGVIAFDLTASLAPASGYTGSAFYGGAQATGSMNGGFQIQNNNATNGGGNDVLVFGKANSVVAGDSVAGVFLWKKSDFVTGADVSDVVTVTSFSYTSRVNGTTSAFSEARFVVQQGSTYLISASVGLTTTSASYSLTDLSSVSWHTYNPTAGITSIGAQVPSPSFGAVTAAGIYLTTTSTGTNGLYLALSQFSTSGTITPVPEPASFASMAGLISLGWAGWARRKR
jgi:hypothetical protein